MINLTEVAERQDREINPDDPDVTKAENTLWNMSIIAGNEMLQRAVYVTERASAPERKDSICHGHRACAVGSLFLGARVPMVARGFGGAPLTEDEIKAMEAEEERDGNLRIRWAMPGVGTLEREEAFKQRPYLGLAYQALNDAALRWMASNREQDLCDYIRDSVKATEGPDAGWMEWLFESDDIIEYKDLAGVVASIVEDARRYVEWGYY